MANNSTFSPSRVALVTSVIVHLLALALAVIGGATGSATTTAAAGSSGGDVAPEAPELFEPGAGGAGADGAEWSSLQVALIEDVPAVEPEPEPEPVAVVAPEPEPEPEPVAVVAPEPEPEPVAVVAPELAVGRGPEPVADAGLESADGAPALSAEAPMKLADAGPVAAALPTDGGGAVAMILADAGNGPASGSAKEQHGTVTSTSTASVILFDGGVAGSANGQDAGIEVVPGGAVGGASEAPMPLVDLSTIAPVDSRVSVLIRVDRVRGTPWAQLVENTLAPMPDYRALVGSLRAKGVDVVSKVDALFIATERPRDVHATTVVAKTCLSDLELVRLVPRAPLALSAIGPTTGKPHGPRQMFSLSPGWLVLAPKSALAEPEWLSKRQSLFAEFVDSEGPFAVADLHNIASFIHLPAMIPGGSAVPLPDRATLTLSPHPQGMLVRGNFTFASADHAREFVVSATSVRKKVLGRWLTRKFLRRYHAYHLVNGMRMKAVGRNVSVVSSMSTADTIGLMNRIAAWSARFFAGVR